jgi:uncharacterized membrane protein required for colicin V production
MLSSLHYMKGGFYALNDALFLGVVVLSSFIGYRLGLTRTIAAFAPYIVAAVLARIGAPHLVKAVTDATSLDEQISAWIAAKAGTEHWEGEFQRWMADPHVQEAMAQHNLSMGSFPALQGSIADMAANYILLMGASSVLFIASILTLRLLFQGILTGIKSIRLLQVVDRIGGLATGLLVGLVGATLAVAVWTPISNVVSERDPSEPESRQSWVNQHWLPLLGVDQNLYFKAAEDWLMPLLTNKMPPPE